MRPAGMGLFLRMRQKTEKVERVASAFSASFSDRVPLAKSLATPHEDTIPKTQRTFLPLLSMRTAITTTRDPKIFPTSPLTSPKAMKNSQNSREALETFEISLTYEIRSIASS